MEDTSALEADALRVGVQVPLSLPIMRLWC